MAALDSFSTARTITALGVIADQQLPGGNEVFDDAFVLLKILQLGMTVRATRLSQTILGGWNIHMRIDAARCCTEGCGMAGLSTRRMSEAEAGDRDAAPPAA